MTISRVNAAGWGIGDKLTSAQANGLDLNGTYSLDKRAGQTDTLSSLITLGGAGRFIQASATGANANTTYQVDAGNLCVFIPATLTASRTYTISNTNAVAGDTITFFFDPSALGSYDVVIKNAAATTIATLGPTGESYWGTFEYSGTAWRAQRSGGIAWKLQTRLFTSTGTWQCPVGVSLALILGVGGGGGGAGGAGGESATNSGGGGSGGGGAKMGVSLMVVTPGVTYDVVIGAGGAGGGGGTAGANGSIGGLGGTSYFDTSTACPFRGGQGGNASSRGTATLFALGGMPSGQSAYSSAGTVAAYASVQTAVPGQGGMGFSSSSVLGDYGRYCTGGSTSFAAGGNAGTGYASGTGGGAGGGGGASEWTGGTGGTGGSGSTASNGSSGTAGPANTGAGGGGGGGGYVGQAGGSGASGGSGAVRIIWVR